MHSDLYLPQVSQAEDANIDPSMLSPFAYAYKRALSTEYPSPTNEKRICLQDHSFELRPERLEYSSPDLPPTPLSPAFPKAIRLQPPPMTPLTVSAPVITHTGMVPTKRVVAMPKKPSKKEPTLILPTTLLSDNGKRSWELFKSLGKGGCGEVYLAKERSDDDSASYVAVKIIKVGETLITGSKAISIRA